MAKQLTIPHILLDRFEQTPQLSAFSFIENQVWKTKNWADTKYDVQSICYALKNADLQKGDCIAILSSARYEAAICDLASACCGGVSTHIHPATSYEENEKILTLIKPSFIFVENGRSGARLSLFLNRRSPWCINESAASGAGEDTFTPKKIFLRG